jgi:hypothetical protein
MASSSGWLWSSKKRVKKRAKKRVKDGARMEQERTQHGIKTVSVMHFTYVMHFT